MQLFLNHSKFFHPILYRIDCTSLWSMWMVEISCTAYRRRASSRNLWLCMCLPLFYIVNTVMIILVVLLHNRCILCYLILKCWRVLLVNDVCLKICVIYGHVYFVFSVSTRLKLLLDWCIFTAKALSIGKCLTIDSIVSAWLDAVVNVLLNVNAWVCCYNFVVCAFKMLPLSNRTDACFLLLCNHYSVISTIACHMTLK